MQRNLASMVRSQGRATRPLGMSAAALAALAGCATDPVSPLDQKPPVAAREPAVYDPGDRVVTQRLDVRPDNPHAGAGPTLESAVTLTAPDAAPERSTLGGRTINQGELARVKYAANGADAKDVLRVLVGEHLGRDVLIDAGVNDKLTMDLDEEMTPGDVADLVEALAMIYGWSIEDMGDMIAVRKQDTAAMALASAPILEARSSFGGQQTAIRIRPMRHIAVNDAETALNSLMSQGAIVTKVGRTLILVDTVNQLDKAGRLLAALDVPAFAGAQIYTFRLSDVEPSDAVELLTQLSAGLGFGGGGAGGVQSAVQFVGFEGSDRLMVLCREASLFPTVNELVRQVDRPASDNARHRFIYHVQHYDPNTLQTLIANFFAARIDQDNTSGSDKMHLTWETQQGLILIQATLEDYADLMTLLRALDRPPQQVALRTVIAEVALTGALEYGVEYFLQAADIDGLGTFDFTAAPGLPASPTGSVFFVGADGLALIQALESEGDVTILTQPYFTTLDGVEATQQVGGEVPTVTADQDSQAQTGGTTAIRREIEYRETGVILTIQPAINESGFVRMKVKLEITDVGAESDLGPEFTTRELTTEVVVPHGRTLVLGGIIDAESRRTVSRVPIIGSAPIFGPLFQNYSDRDTRTELLLTITPSVINDPFQTSMHRDPFVQAAASVRAALGTFENELPQGMLHTGPASLSRGALIEAPAAAPEPIDEPADDAEGAPPELPPILKQMIEQSRPATSSDDPR